MPWFSARYRLPLALIGLEGKFRTKDVGTGILAFWLRRMERQMIMSFTECSKAHFQKGRWRACDRAWPPEQIMELLFNDCIRSHKAESGVARLFSAARYRHQRGSGACSHSIS
jgi:hypothetical protein